jgi:transglutaminase-like putative cysteine protease
MSEVNRSALRLTTAAALATATATLGLTRLVQPGRWLTLCLALILLTALVGYLTRAGRLPKPLVLTAQLLTALTAVTALRAPATAIAGFIPDPNSLHALAAQVTNGRNDILHEAPRALATDGITTIVIMLCVTFAILIDAIAVTYQRAVLVGLPLLAVYLIPATRLPGGLGWLAFSATAVGYLVLVSAEGHDRLSGWGRTLGGTQRTAGQNSNSYLSGPHAALSRRIGTTALIAALAVPLLVPTLPGVFVGGGGSGTGPGTISIDQNIDLRRSLSSSAPVPVLQYTTTAKDPRADYLRMSVLDNFDGDSWTAAASSDTAPLDAAAGVVIPGLTTSGIARTPVTTRITVVGDLAFSTVPAPYAPSQIVGLNNPVYDPSTLVVTTADPPGRSRQNQRYTVNSAEITPTASQLAGAEYTPDPSIARYLRLPADFPDQVRALAHQITSGDTTAFQRALALQNYFLTKFTYSLSVPSGDGNSAIQQFLNDRKGFCQQFAGTMAAMARALGIPAVVAVGFTPGSVRADGSYSVTTHDAHAWPMLYFGGVGWVRFEPTPSRAAAGPCKARTRHPARPVPPGPRRTPPPPRVAARARSGRPTAAVSVKTQTAPRRPEDRSTHGVRSERFPGGSSAGSSPAAPPRSPPNWPSWRCSCSRPSRPSAASPAGAAGGCWSGRPRGISRTQPTLNRRRRTSGPATWTAGRSRRWPRSRWPRGRNSGSARTTSGSAGRTATHHARPRTASPPRRASTNPRLRR